MEDVVFSMMFILAGLGFLFGAMVLGYVIMYYFSIGCAIVTGWIILRKGLLSRKLGGERKWVKKKMIG